MSGAGKWMETEPLTAGGGDGAPGTAPTQSHKTPAVISGFCGAAARSRRHDPAGIIHPFILIDIYRNKRWFGGECCGSAAAHTPDCPRREPSPGLGIAAAAERPEIERRVQFGLNELLKTLTLLSMLHIFGVFCIFFMKLH